MKVATEFGAAVEICPRRGTIRILTGIRRSPRYRAAPEDRKRVNDGADCGPLGVDDIPCPVRGLPGNPQAALRRAHGRLWSTPLLWDPRQTHRARRAEIHRTGTPDEGVALPLCLRRRGEHPLDGSLKRRGGRGGEKRPRPQEKPGQIPSRVRGHDAPNRILDGSCAPERGRAADPRSR